MAIISNADSNMFMIQGQADQYQYRGNCAPTSPLTQQ